MAIHRPKILSPVVFDAAVNFVFTVSVAGSLDTQKTAVVPAGTYYVAWDGQSDDLLHVLLTQMVAQLSALGSTYYPSIYINDNAKVVFDFNGAHYTAGAGWEDDVRLDHTSSTAALVKALGFDHTADDTSTGTNYPEFVADYQHGYGWYSDADGQLVSLLVEDRHMVVTPQSISLAGYVASQFLGERFTNELVLDWLPRSLMHSREKAYTDAPVYPYARNVPLECWWQAAKDGTQFRVYREGRNGTDVFIEYGTADASSTTTMVDGAKSWDTDPQEFVGKLARSVDSRSGHTRMYINSHTATTLTTTNANPNNRNYALAGQPIYIFDQRYQTYVVDLKAMSVWEPPGHDDEDYYSIAIPLLRYES